MYKFTVDLPSDTPPLANLRALPPKQLATILVNLDTVFGCVNNDNTAALIAEHAKELKSVSDRSYLDGINAGKVASLESQHTAELYTSLISRKSADDTKIDQRLSDMSKLLEAISTSQSVFIGNITGRGTATSAGVMGEGVSTSFIESLFPDATIQNTSKTSNALDLLVTLPDFRLGVEIKNKQTITKADVDKFEANVKANTLNWDACIMISLRTDVVIPNRANSQMAMINNIPVVYLTNMMKDSGQTVEAVVSILMYIKKNGSLPTIDESILTTCGTIQGISADLTTCSNMTNKGMDMIRQGTSMIGVLISQLNLLSGKLKTYIPTMPYTLRNMTKRNGTYIDNQSITAPSTPSTAPTASTASTAPTAPTAPTSTSVVLDHLDAIGK